MDSGTAPTVIHFVLDRPGGDLANEYGEADRIKRVLEAFLCYVFSMAIDAA